ncbi:GIY-YIG nuclease family protein [Marinoscillum pacificum]|uniref:GIY-YIG nuclease family protein n=1 Tax=Marinoscillum pacificum TaxID=392723 RepID=UPI002157FF5C|nr:GIY-YIG nuclease family protein [Marinoscillum pacificum]
MTYIVYILHSSKLNKFYTGSSELAASERLELHLNKYYSNNKFSAKADDWKLFLAIDCSNKSQALAIEKHIKKMKSSKYITNLKQYPEMIAKLLDTYK